jgi:hypothetical protein
MSGVYTELAAAFLGAAEADYGFKGARATIAISPYSQIKVDYIKSVRLLLATGLLSLPVLFKKSHENNTQAMNSYPSRICLQGHHSRKHHISRSPRQRLCRGTKPAEGPSMHRNPER